MSEACAGSLLDAGRPGRLGEIAGRLLAFAYRLTGRFRYDDFRLEQLCGLQILVIPSVANPKLLRTGAFLASRLDALPIGTSTSVLDLGAGTGICSLIAARKAGRVLAVDINPAAVTCAQINATINALASKIELREGDLFAPVNGERFDLVIFNPPFLLGAPRDMRDAAWRADGLAERFAEGLADHLTPCGMALLLLSTFGNASSLFEFELRRRGFIIKAVSCKRFINETLYLLRVVPRPQAARG